MHHQQQQQSNPTRTWQVATALVSAVVLAIFLVLGSSLLSNDQDKFVQKTMVTTMACDKLPRDTCNQDVDCEWCVSYAIPSRCYSHEQAKQLPNGVFVCDTARNAAYHADNEVDTHKSTNNEEQTTHNGYLEITRRSSPIGMEPNHPHPILCDNKVSQLSGYYHVSPKKKYFFWFFESRRNPAQDPLVLWLTGGPGCSSEIALFAENGPCSVNAAGDGTNINSYSWNTRANLLYVDQPAGTGFSIGPETDRNEKAVSADLYAFLVAFLTSSDGNKYGKLPFFVTGESYAGHYVPAAAHRIFENNKRAAASGQFQINLRGVAVGNGLTDPELQYPLFPAMAKPFVSAEAYETMNKAVAPCVRQIRACQALSKWGLEFGARAVCSNAVNFCNIELIGPYVNTGLNQYDYRIKCKVPGLCYDFSNIEKYLSRPDVRSALGIPMDAGAWQECSPSVHMSLLGDWMLDYAQTLPALLEAGIPVLIYAGAADYICNWMGNKAWVTALDWAGKDAFNAARDLPWKDGKGEVRSAKGFTFLKIFDAGHMAPMDDPKTCLSMLDQFLFSTFDGATTSINDGIVVGV